MRFIAAALGLLVIAGCQTQATKTASVEFALIGDNPYHDYNFPKYERMIDRINADPDIDWVVHLGDMKDGIDDCSDESLRALKTLNDRFAAPFVLTPGDNDWFDCSRADAGGYDRRDRLQMLRRIFYSEPSALPVTSQAESAAHPEFVENVYWMQDDVMFATLHLVGLTGQEGGLDIHNELMTAGVAWLEEIFRQATANDARGVFIATQADIYPITSEKYLLSIFCPKCPAVHPLFGPVHAAFLKHAKQYQRPIMLAVGDTHIFRVDKPLYDGANVVENFTRVEGFGEGQVHWVRVKVDTADSQVFTVYQELIPENLGVGWREEDKEK